MPRDPADVRRAPVDVVFLHVEDDAVSAGDARKISGRRVHHAFGLARRAAGVEDIEHVLGVHRLGVALVGSLGHQVLPPHVAALLHSDARRLSHSLDYHDLFDRGRPGKRVVDVGFERHNVAAPPRAVARHQDLGLGVVDALAQRLGGKAAEHHAVRRPDLGAGEQGDGQFRHHPHVHGNAVALLDAQRLQRVGAAVDLALEHPEREHSGVARLAFPNNRRLVAPVGPGVPVHAVVSDVQLSTHKPLRPRDLPFEHLVPALEPVEVLSLLGPEGFEVRARPVVDRGIGNIRLTAKVVRGREGPVLFQQGLKPLLLSCYGVCHGSPPGTDLQLPFSAPSRFSVSCVNLRQGPRNLKALQIGLYG